MKTSKRFLTLLLTLVMLVGIFTVSAFAQETTVLTLTFDTTSYATGLPSYSSCTIGEGQSYTLPGPDGISWSVAGTLHNPGTRFTYEELKSFASAEGIVGFVAFGTVEEEKPESIPSTPIIRPADPIPGTRPPRPSYGPMYDLTIAVYVDDYYWDCGYGCKSFCDHFGYCDNPWFESSSIFKDYTSSKHSYGSDYRYKGAYVAGTRVNISASKYITRNGVKYEFVGWYGNGTFGRRTSTSTTFTMPACDTVIYATYEPYGYSYGNYCGTGYCSANHTHTVTYTDGVPGKTIFKDVVKNVRHGNTTPTIKDPTRPGYRFVGWSPKVSKTTTKCVVYEAQWTTDVAPNLTNEHVAFLKGYGKGEFRPANNMTRGEFAVLLYRLLDDATVKAYYTTANSFSDVNSDDWYNEAISTLANAGVIKDTKYFEPEEYITRAEMISMLAAFYTSNSNYYSYKCNYKDVPVSYWAYNEISLAQEMGWIKGYGANTFLPDATITRAEVAAIVNRVLGRDCEVRDTKNYTDVAKDAWYYADVLEATIAH